MNNSMWDQYSIPCGMQHSTSSGRLMRIDMPIAVCMDMCWGYVRRRVGRARGPRSGHVRCRQPMPAQPTCRSVMADNPSAMADDPSAMADNPSAMADDPSAMADNPSAMADNPLAMADNPSAMADNPSAMADNSHS